MGDSLAAANGQSANGGGDALDAFLALNDNFSGASYTFADSMAGRRAANNPMGLPMSSVASNAGGLYDRNRSDVIDDTTDASGRRALTVGRNGSVMSTLAGGGLTSAQQSAGYGQLARYGQLSASNFDAKGTPIVQAGQQLYVDLNDLTAGDAKLGGALIANESNNRALIQQAVQARAAQAATNANAGFADGRDARDMRLSFGYQSMMSREMSDLGSMSNANYAEARATTLSARETAVDWVRSVVGTDRAGNVIAGAVNGWLAGGEAALNLPDTIAGIPSAVSRLANGTASAATQFWADPAGSAAGAMASGVDSFRTNVNQAINGNGFSLGSGLFAIGTMGVPLGRAEGIAAATAVDAAEAPLGFTRAYRAVSPAEYDSALQSGKFSQGPNALEGKWFSDSYENALLHGDALEGAGKYRILQADLPDNAPSLFKMPNLDGRGPARYLHLEDLMAVTPRPFNGGK